jgi:flagellar motility protein MotE (MotC chaperone)
MDKPELNDLTLQLHEELKKIAEIDRLKERIKSLEKQKDHLIRLLTGG